MGLMAAEGVEAFYDRFGFERRPEGRPGMYLSVQDGLRTSDEGGR